MRGHGEAPNALGRRDRNRRDRTPGDALSDGGENVLAAELYDEVVAKRVPVEEWPAYVHLRMSGGEPLSASAADNDW